MKDVDRPILLPPDLPGARMVIETQRQQAERQLGKSRPETMKRINEGLADRHTDWSEK